MTDPNAAKKERPSFKPDSSLLTSSLSPSHSQEAKTQSTSQVTFHDLDWLNEDEYEETGMWVFGYGSLCWHQGFTFEKSLTGFIQGFTRKFWQGNTTHRGTQKKPGRVATLIEDKKGRVWGKAFQVTEKEAFLYLNNRECKLGGYLTTISTFYPRQEAKETKSLKPFPVILYIATPSNRLWMGDSPLAQIANEILESAGNSGHNVEYLLRLAAFVRNNIPEDVDDHLFALEILVLSKIKEKNLCLKTLMGENEKINKVEGQDVEQENQQPEGEIVAAGEGRTDSLQFISTVPSKKLRCVNIF